MPLSVKVAGGWRGAASQVKVAGSWRTATSVYVKVAGSWRTVSTPWSLTSASYDNVSFDLGAQDATPTCVSFKPDGTKMYVGGQSTDTIYQYSLSTPWDLATASYDSVSFDAGGQVLILASIALKSNGTKMYVMDGAGDVVFQYSLSTPWDLATASYDNVSFSVANEDSGQTDIVFKSDGTKMYTIGAENNAVYQYSLSTPWSLTSASYDNVSFITGSQDTSPTSLTFKLDGTKMHVGGSDNEAVFQYSLSTPWDLATASYDNVFFSVASQTLTNRDIAFKSDGTKMYVIGSDSDAVHQYSL